MTLAFAVLLCLHGLAHLAGFAVAFGLPPARNAAASPMLLARRWPLGARGRRAIGLCWLVLAVAFVSGAPALLMGEEWWRPHVLWTAVLSIAACALSRPAAWLGIPVNGLMLILLFFGPAPLSG